MIYRKKNDEDFYRNRHSCFLLQYHLVFVTKYRHPVIRGKVKDLLYSLIQESFENSNLNLLELNGEEDHIHMLFEAMPNFNLGEFVNMLKTRTSRLIRKEYGNTVLKQYYWKPYFWSNSYFVASVSDRSLRMVQEYIKNQGN